QTFKNCRILGYQDTYRSKKGTRGYFKNCWIEGATDFIYAGGTTFFDDCTINCVKGGGYIVAPEDAYSTIPKASTVCQKFLRVGFIFRNCNITANSDVAANTYYLGRPWNVTAGAFYLNCKLGKHIKAEGWQTMGGNETTACFAEFNSMDVNGLPVDVTGRVTWSFQLPQLDVENLLNPTYIYALSYTTSYDPETITALPSSPTNVKMIGNTISWDAVSGVAGYLVYKNNKFLAAPTETSFVDNSGESGFYSVLSISTLGVLSSAATLTGIETVQYSKVEIKISKDEIFFSEPVKFALYSLSGLKMIESKTFQNSTSTSGIYKGIYLLNTMNEYAQEQIIKINLP
ncbi:MAG: pectinesterase family protein, partial [Paludibacter sp.]